MKNNKMFGNKKAQFGIIIIVVLVVILLIIFNLKGGVRRIQCETSGGDWQSSAFLIGGGCNCPIDKTISSSGRCITFEEAGCTDLNGIPVCPAVT